MKSLSRVQLFATPWTVAYRLLGPWDFPGKNTGVDCHLGSDGKESACSVGDLGFIPGLGRSPGEGNGNTL